MSIELDEMSVKKINLIDKFRQRFSTADNEKLKLPQIIVVGDQSSGKSSILEAISGIKLPRGVNTVTKCPVIIQMRHSDVERKQIKCKDENFREIENTEEEINRVQREVLHNQLTDEPITLHIESPNVQTLTIIDLPGIVKTQTSDQSEDIIGKTHNIAKMYMSQENSLIICVLPANQDISTTTTIKLASQCNKNKSRIIGVLTKLDKIDDKEASMIPDILQNRKLPIKKGFYGLVVSDEFLGMDSKNRQKFEINIFRKRNLWTEEHKQRLGLNRFIEALVIELMQLINNRLPQLGLNIRNEITETENNLSRYSQYYDNPAFQSHFISQISNGVQAKIENILINADEEINKFPQIEEFLTSQQYLYPIGSHSTFLFLWHKISKALYDGFRTNFNELFELRNAPYKNLNSLDNLIKECRVENVLVFNSSKPFKLIVDKVLERFKKESSKCIEKCYLIINHIIDTVLIVDIDEQFLTVKIDVLDICHEILDSQHEEIKKMLDFIFKSEQSYFSQDAIVESYTNDEELLLVVPPNLNYPQVVNKQAISNPTASNVYYSANTAGGISTTVNTEANQFRNAKWLKDFLVKYIENLILRLGDTIPNLIRLSLFVNFKEAVHSKLSLFLFEPDRMEKYFSLDGVEEEEWQRLQEKLRMLKQSKTDLDKLIASEKRINGVINDSL